MAIVAFQAVSFLHACVSYMHVFCKCLAKAIKQSGVFIYYTLFRNFSKLLDGENGLAFNGWNMSTLQLKTIMKWIYQ